MSQSALVPVQFHGASLFVTTISGVPHVAMRPIVEAIGLDWKAQYSRIQRHAVLKTCVVITTTQMPGDDQARDVFMLPLDKLNGWLFGVSVSRVRPELRTKLTQYQAECFDVLANHFGAAVKPPVSAPTQKAIPPQPSEDQVREALNMGMVMAGYVQQAVAKAVLRGGDDWRQLRWLVSLVTDSKHPTPVIVNSIETDEMLTSFDRLAQDINDPGLLVSNAQLANLASACSTRLAQRMQVAAA